MEPNQFALLKNRRFLPLFITQFLGAFHDNVFKNALVVLLLYGILSSAGYNTELLVTLAAGIFILPYVIFSGIGGQLADKYAKNRMIRIIKLAEIAIALLGATALFSGSILLSLIALFALGTQSAFFSPSKYSILPQHLKDNELIGGNALLNTGTFLAILTGTMAGTLLVTFGEPKTGIALVSGLMIFTAIIGYISSLSIPRAEPQAPDLKINFNPFTETIDILKFSFKQKKGIVQAILGAAWFYFLGGMFTAQFPNYTEGTLGASEHVLAFFLATFSIGIAIGGLLNNRLLKGRVEAVYVPLAVLGISIFSIDLYFAASPFADALQIKMNTQAPVTLIGLSDFLSTIQGWRIIMDVFIVAFCGGLFVVPLKTIIQHYTEDAVRSRVLAGSNIMDAIFILSSSALSALLISLGWEIRELFLTFALMNLVMAIYICRLLPDYLLKTTLQGIFKILYKVEIRGLENIEKAGDRAVIVGNHVSLLDAPLLAAFLPGRPMFAINSHVAQWLWVKPFLKLVDAFPLNPTNPFSLKNLIRKVEEGRQVVIFPEGRLTETGALMKVYDGPGMIADKADAMILPVRLDGVQHTFLARLKGKVPLFKFPKITITILEPRKFEIPAEIKGRARRAQAGRQLYDLMEEMMFITSDRNQTLFEALLQACQTHGGDAIIAEDVERKPMNFKKLIQGSTILGRKFSNMTDKGENVGVLLPNSLGAIVTFFGLQLFGRIPAMLNFSAGALALTSACKTANIKTVLTSRKFITLGRLEDLITKIEQHAKIIYIEDIKDEITFADKLHAYTASACVIHRKQKITPDDPALILFTSGSEGTPKGVVLSHANIMANVVQLTARVDFNRQDIVFNCLPMFHSFGLTGGTLLPILSGVKTFLYPSPLHYRIVPELIYSSNATMMFGTDTFLNGYARMADPYDFYRMRYIFAGAEKVKEETRKIYMDRFGVRILEGYGATETAPALTLNSPMHFKGGTVGRLLAGIEYKLEHVQGVEKGGRLFVRGPNIMLGYYRAQKPAVLEPPVDGWYDTGDIVDIDSEGFVTILGRAKRFAKIAGEMISLTSVEAMIQNIYPQSQHALAAIPDAKKGEQLILLTTHKGVIKSDLSAYAKQHGISELAIPKTIIEIDEIPVLGSGKTDYAAVQKRAEQK